METNTGMIILFGLGILCLIMYLLGYWKAYKKLRELKGQIGDERKDAVKRSRSVISGQMFEQIAPFLPGFNHKPTECRFIGKPIDFIVLKGMDDKNISEVVFVEVKSGSSGLSQQEKNLRDAIQAKRVSWEEYRVPAK